MILRYQIIRKTPSRRPSRLFLKLSLIDTFVGVLLYQPLLLVFHGDLFVLGGGTNNPIDSNKYRTRIIIVFVSINLFLRLRLKTAMRPILLLLLFYRNWVVSIFKVCNVVYLFLCQLLRPLLLLFPSQKSIIHRNIPRHIISNFRSISAW
jgi:ABC-type uncharacterized transport system permease subunit